MTSIDRDGDKVKLQNSAKKPENTAKTTSELATDNIKDKSGFIKRYCSSVTLGGVAMGAAKIAGQAVGVQAAVSAVAAAYAGAKGYNEHFNERARIAEEQGIAGPEKIFSYTRAAEAYKNEKGYKKLTKSFNAVANFSNCDREGLKIASKKTAVAALTASGIYGLGELTEFIPESWKEKASPIMEQARARGKYALGLLKVPMPEGWGEKASTFASKISSWFSDLFKPSEKLDLPKDTYKPVTTEELEKAKADIEAQSPDPDVILEQTIESDPEPEAEIDPEPEPEPEVVALADMPPADRFNALFESTLSTLDTETLSQAAQDDLVKAQAGNLESIQNIAFYIANDLEGFDAFNAESELNRYDAAIPFAEIGAANGNLNAIKFLAQLDAMGFDIAPEHAQAYEEITGEPVQLAHEEILSSAHCKVTGDINTFEMECKNGASTLIKSGESLTMNVNGRFSEVTFLTDNPADKITVDNFAGNNVVTFIQDNPNMLNDDTFDTSSQMQYTSLER